MGRIWSKLMCGLAVAGLGIASASGAVAEVLPNKPTTVIPEQVEFRPNGGFSPTVLSKTKATPVALIFEAKVGRYDGGHPPALHELIVQLDKNIALNLEGYPSCHAVGIQIDSPMTMEERCRNAVIGTGTAHVEIDVPDAEPVLAVGRLSIFNGALENGVRTLYVDMAFSEPVPGHLVTKVEIKKIHEGRFATQATFAFPKIAGDSGSITSLKLRIKRRLPLEGAWFTPILARCPDGKLQIHAVANLLDYKTGESINSRVELLRTCTGR